MTQLCWNGRRRLLVYALLAGYQQRREVRMNGEPVANAPETAGLRSRPLSERKKRENPNNINQMRLSQPMPPSLFPTATSQGLNVVRGLWTYPVAVVADL